MSKEIVLFKDVTTESILLELEESSKKYVDLYCDMNNKEERKFVKDKSSLIYNIIKTLDRARIDKSKEFKLTVESEARDIRERLEIANLPFTSLIDAHKKERADILKIEKKNADYKAMVLKLPFDHDDAIAENELFDFKIEKIKLDQIAHDEIVAKNAIIDAELEKQRIIEQAKINLDNAVKAEAIRGEQAIIKEELESLNRKANIDHVTSVCTKAKEALMQYAGLTEKDAINAIKAIRNNKIHSTTINF